MLHIGYRYLVPEIMHSVQNRRYRRIGYKERVKPLIGYREPARYAIHTFFCHWSQSGLGIRIQAIKKDPQQNR
jgi:hypothetical protein